MKIKTIHVILILGTALLMISARDVEGKHRKNFAKLNKHLEKEVKSDDPVLNRAALKKLLDDKSSGCRLNFGSYMDTLKKLIDYTEMEADSMSCKGMKHTELAEELDSDLADESREKTPNYPLTRIDRIMQHYSNMITRYCVFWKEVPKLKFGFKQLAFDQVNKMLVDELPSNDDIDANMARAEQLLTNLKPKDGALADALKQFLELKLTLNEDTCNMKGYEILHKNSLSTKLYNYSYHMTHNIIRRVDKIFVHYYKKHEQLCRPVVIETLKSMMKDLNPNTYRRVLGVAGARFLEPWKYTKIVEELEQKEIDGNFYTPLIVQRVEQRLAAYRDEDESFDLIHIYIGDFHSHELIDYLKAISHADPNSQFLNLQVDERAGRKYVDEAKVKQILDDYLFAPCKDYMKSFGGIIKADLFDALVNSEHKRSTKKTAMSELTYLFSHYAYQSCKKLVSDEDVVFEGIKEAILPYGRGG